MAITSTRNGKVIDGVDQPAEQRVEPAAVIADQGADDGAEDAAGTTVAKSAICRSIAVGPDHAREHVAAEIVGAERMRGARRPAGSRV